ncbi:hypothetical protein F2Q70_00041055 [Brassica cretica]|uniref:HP domain-containing protein n=1 Tax=Brassica cretica TaxID=69181 RepID=A0A8S9K0F3_BRACR|nr:hypothetical protein F2Q70_00041055 [Brassica cretica]
MTSFLGIVECFTAVGGVNLTFIRGTEIWRIENFQPVLVPKSEHGKFYMGDTYIVLQTTQNKAGTYLFDIHFWIGKDTSQDEAGTAAVKTVELDAGLGGRAVQHREIQGHESDKFLSYFKPCIIPLEGGVASGFKKLEEEEFETRLYTCKGKRAVHLKQVPFARSSLNHDDVFILDTKEKIYQFNGANSNIQERAKALAVVQYLKDKFHEGTCDVANSSPSSNSPPQRPGLTSRSSQRAAALAALSQVLTNEKKKSPDTSPSAEAKDEKAFSEVDASEESAEAKEEEEVSPAADAITEEAGTTGATFTYQQLQAKSEKPVKGIDFKRREAYLSEEEFETVFGMEKEAFYKLPRWKQDLLKKKFNLF